MALYLSLKPGDAGAMRIGFVLLGASALLLNLRLASAEFPSPRELPRQEAFPDPLVMIDGAKVASAVDWQQRRKPELKALFQHYMYGRYPAAPERVAARVLFEDGAAFGGQGTLKEVELTLGPPEWPKIYLLVAAPREGKSPCFVGANFGGNHSVTGHPDVRLSDAWMAARRAGVVNERATEASRGTEADSWPLEEIVRRGYAVATFYCGDVQPDRPEAREGLRAVLEQDGPAADGAGTATIMSWAWGVHRAIDYLATDAAIDPRRIATVGHSRLGKTALVAGAFDERVALVVANQAGCGGSGPSRHDDPKAEGVAAITKAFPHWFCGNFTAFGDDPARLPFDQHALVALCAAAGAVHGGGGGPVGQPERAVRRVAGGDAGVRTAG